MASTSKTTSFRPRKELADDFDEILLWCKDHNSSFTSVINSFLPAINYALHNHIFRDDKRKRYIRADFGDVALLEPNHDCSYRT